MITALINVLVALIPLIVAKLLEKDDHETRYPKDLTRFDAALAGRDADALTLMFDRLRIPASPGGDLGGPGYPAPAERQL